MGRTYCYDQIGKEYNDEYYNETEFLDPTPHTPGGIWSSNFSFQRISYKHNVNFLLNHYVKLSSHIMEVRLCYDGNIKNMKVKLLEIQGTSLHI